MSDRIRFSALLSRVGADIGKLSADQQAKIRRDFDDEAKSAAAAKRPVNPTAFLGDGVIGAEVAKAWREEYLPVSEGGAIGRGVPWAVEHGAQAFRNFVPALS